MQGSIQACKLSPAAGCLLRRLRATGAITVQKRQHLHPFSYAAPILYEFADSTIPDVQSRRCTELCAPWPRVSERIQPCE